MTHPPDIDATELISVRPGGDGRSLRIRMRDESGQVLTVALPVKWFGQLLNALPHPSDADVHRLESWNMDRLNNGQDLLVTLRTPEGRAVTFAMKPGQVAGMATIATYGNTDKGTVH